MNKIGGSKKRYNQEQQNTMIDLYINKKQPCPIIANQFKCSEATIRNYLKRNNIPIRNTSEASKLHVNNLGRFNSLNSRMEKNHAWSGGTQINHAGYNMVRKSNKYIMKHRLVMEEHLGRNLTKTEVVHHLDGNRNNNHISNLHLFENNGEHGKYHQVIREAIRNELFGDGQ